MPVYKTEESHLRKAIESVINQSYRELEIVLVDDGSPDQCGAICDTYAETDDRVRVIHKKNGGVSSARNYGLETVTGDYIFFVDISIFGLWMMIRWYALTALQNCFDVIGY